MNPLRLKASVPSTQTVQWYAVPMGGSRIGEGFRFRPKFQGQYYAEAIDLNTGCVSEIRTESLFFPLAEPLIRDIDKFCEPGENTYTIVIEVTNSELITHTAGQLENRGKNLFAIVHIPIEESVTVTASVANSECATTFMAAPPSCICDSLPAPQLLHADLSNGDPIIRYCSSSPSLN